MLANGADASQNASWSARGLFLFRWVTGRIQEGEETPVIDCMRVYGHSEPAALAITATNEPVPALPV